MLDAELCRSRANEASVLAHREHNLATRDSLQDIARSWQRLAIEAEMQARHRRRLNVVAQLQSTAAPPPAPILVPPAE
jgi:hypothetical protein